MNTCLLIFPMTIFMNTVFLGKPRNTYIARVVWDAFDGTHMTWIYSILLNKEWA